MSELRQRCEEFVNDANNYVAADYIDDKKISIAALEAFAKGEQIKGMERIKHVLQAHHARVWLAEQIDAEITKLKEGG